MEWKKEIKILSWITAVFVFAFFMPLEEILEISSENSLIESLVVSEPII